MGKHEKTLAAMLRHPRPANLRWSDVEGLLEHYGAQIKAKGGSAIVVSLGGHKGFSSRPHPDDKADKGAIENALELLKMAGLV